MHPSFPVQPAESTEHYPSSNGQSPCPLYAGALVGLGSTHRCMRCAFVTCVGCEGTRDDSFEVGG